MNTSAINHLYFCRYGIAARASRIAIGKRYLENENVKLPTRIKFNTMAKINSCLNLKPLLNNSETAPKITTNGEINIFLA